MQSSIDHSSGAPERSVRFKSERYTARGNIMALVATDLPSEPRAFSVGPLKVQIFNVVVQSGDTSGTITCDHMDEVFACVIDGLSQSAAPAVAVNSNVVTLAFANPGAAQYCTAMCWGR